MNFSSIISDSPSRWGLPLAVFSLVYGVFFFLDSHASPEVKLSLSQFLRGGKYESYLGVLPTIVEDTFNKLFGARHLSRKCVATSAILSIAAIIITCLFTTIYNYGAAVEIVSKFGEFAHKLPEALQKNDKTKDFGVFLANLGETRLWFGLLIRG